MKDILEEFKSKIATYNEFAGDQHINFEQFVNNCTVGLAVGGEGNRLKNITAKYKVNKNALALPNGQTMVERTIEMFKSIGLTRFVILVYTEADSVISLLGDGSKYGITIEYSHDPGKSVGRGGAIKNAYINNKISKDHYLLVHNPDDQITGDQKKYLKKIINQHLFNEEQGAVASAVAVEGGPYPFSVFQIKNSRIIYSEYHPTLPLPSHIGMTIFSPSIDEYFDKHFDLDKKADYETVLFPILQEEKKLFTCRLPAGSWIPVNDEKGLKKLIQYLEEKFNFSDSKH